jgi:hypothetical protein
MLEIIIEAWAYSSPFAVWAAYHFGRAHGITKTSQRYQEILNKYKEML